MANDLRIATAARNAAADAIGALLDGGHLRIYTVGSGRPAGPGTAIGDQVLLAELDFGTPAFGGAIAGVITANAITAEADAPATGTAAWYRATDASHNAVIDGEVGTSASDLNLATLSIVEHAEVSVSSFTYTMPST